MAFLYMDDTFSRSNPDNSMHAIQDTHDFQRREQCLNQLGSFVCCRSIFNYTSAS